MVRFKSDSAQRAGANSRLREGLMASPSRDFRACDYIEKARTDHRPGRITTLFVAESAPIGGTFFYYGNGHLGRHLQRSIEEVVAGDGDFLERFKSYGWYLDDLVLAPVNHLTPRERRAAHLGATHDLERRIAEYRPLAIVCLLKSISACVRAAASGAGFDGPFFEVPFPGNGQQRRFHLQMIDIIPEFPREPLSQGSDPTRGRR
jgi:hypothetical protein